MPRNDPSCRSKSETSRRPAFVEWFVYPSIFLSLAGCQSKVFRSLVPVAATPAVTEVNASSDTLTPLQSVKGTSDLSFQRASEGVSGYPGLRGGETPAVHVSVAKPINLQLASLVQDAESTMTQNPPAGDGSTQEISASDSATTAPEVLPGPGVGEPEPVPDVAAANIEPLSLGDVVASTRVSFPQIQQAIAAQQEASGGIVTALGSFDDKVEAFSLNTPLGFYENYRQGVGVKHPLVSGGFLYGGYRIGRGDFGSWDGDLETDQSGEFKVGFEIPLIRNRIIDQRRADLGAARLRRGQTDPELFATILSVQSGAARAFWDWVVAGKLVEIREEILDIGIKRAAQFEERLRVKDIAPFTQITNLQLVADRRIALIAAEQKFAETAVKLSLYLRTPGGQMVLPDPRAVPANFPPIEIPERSVQEIVDEALVNRPELQVLRYDISILSVQLRQADNERLPQVNLAMEASQDVGQETDPKGTKQPAKLGVGVVIDQAVQRRKAIGKMQQLRAKIAQTNRKLELTGNKIATDVQAILVAIDATNGALQQAEENLTLSERALELANIAFEAGNISIIDLNIQEVKLADAKAKVAKFQGDLSTQLALLVLALGEELPTE